MKEVKNSGTEIKTRLNNKVQKIKENRGNVETPKRNVLNNFNNTENYVENKLNNSKLPNNIEKQE